MSRISRLRKNVRDRAKRGRSLIRQWRKQREARIWRGKRTADLIRKKDPKAKESVGRYHESLARERRFVKAIRASRAKLAGWTAQLRKAERAAGGKRARAIRWARSHVGTREHPPGSNGGPKISGWQRAFGFGRVPWCGIFVGHALRAAGVKGITSRVASVALIEQDAKSGRNGFRSWHGARSGNPSDAAVIGGPGVHVELVVKRHWWGLSTIGGNTSFEGSSGSQSNGGCVAARRRPWSSVRGCARPRY